MPSDRSRGREELCPRYLGIVAQQGRVILDRDLNALQEIVNCQILADALNEIGPCGTPDDGFAISLPPAGPTGLPFSHFSAPQPFDFLISSGTMYVGGQRVVLPPRQPSWSYFNQPDWLNPDPPSVLGTPSQSFPVREFIFLEAHEQEVGAGEEPSLLDVALGGPDTTQRIRLMRRVRRLAVAATDCASALEEAVKIWAMQGFKFDPANLRLLPQAQLQVSFTSAPTTTNPCDPVVQGGYLGATNQLIRLQFGQPNSSGANPKARLLWGYDNASFLYRVNVQNDGKTLNLEQAPVDAFHIPRTGQVVEVLRWAVRRDITEAGPTGHTSVAQGVAEATGFVASVVKYNNEDNSVLLDSVLPAEYVHDPVPLILRIWQGQVLFDASTPQPITLTDPTGQTAPGIQVTITVPTDSPAGAAFPVGAYWMLAVRPSTPQQIYPEQFLQTPQWPDGPRRWVCPLAVIDWEARFSFSASPPVGLGGGFSRPAFSEYMGGNILSDCRQHFDNLVTLTNRRFGGCCTLMVTPADAPKLQEILDKAVANSQRVTVCLTPGIYYLSQPLRLGTQHSNLTLEACQGGVFFAAAKGREPAFLDGLIVLNSSRGVTLRRLSFLLPEVPFAKAGGRIANLNLDMLLKIRGPNISNLYAGLGLRVMQCADLTVQECVFRIGERIPAGDPIRSFEVAILVGGNCQRLTLERNRFSCATPPGPLDQELFRSTVGFLQAPFTSIEKVNPLENDALVVLEAEFVPTSLQFFYCRNNFFENLTHAVLIYGEASQVQFDENTVRGCLAGLWLLSLRSFGRYFRKKYETQDNECKLRDNGSRGGRRRLHPVIPDDVARYRAVFHRDEVGRRVDQVLPVAQNPIGTQDGFRAGCLRASPEP